MNCSPSCYTTSYPTILPFKWQEAGSGHSAWTFCGGWLRITRVAKDVSDNRLFSLKGGKKIWIHSYDNTVWGRMFEREREHYIMKDFIILFFTDIRRVWAVEFKWMIETREIYVEVKTAYICQSPPVLWRKHLRGLRVDQGVTLKGVVKKCDMSVWSELTEIGMA